MTATLHPSASNSLCPEKSGGAGGGEQTLCEHLERQMSIATNLHSSSFAFKEVDFALVAQVTQPSPLVT